MISLEEFTSKPYDYIVVGGGTAGLLIAARLSEDSNVTVGVLEAGGNRLNDPMVDCPNAFMQLWDKPEYDWSFQTVPQKGTKDRIHGWSRGKCLGGSSAINFNMFAMASKQDIDNWAELGNEGWSFEEMKPYYRKYETYHPPSKEMGAKINDKYVDPVLRGNSGPIQICWSESDFTWYQGAWGDACKNMGFPEPRDPRTGNALGGFNQLNTIEPKLHRRSYSARAFYEPNAHRPNLHVLTDALVSKIIFDESTAGSDAVRATGVEFTHSDATHSVNVKTEVILCGGVVNSPQILELSGIGSSSLLQSHGINTIVDNPNVGENLMDHPASGFVVQVKDEYPSAEVLTRNPEILGQAFQAWAEHGAGPLSAAPTPVAYLPLSLIAPEMSQTSIETMAKKIAHSVDTPAATVAAPLLAKQLLSEGEAAVQFVGLAIGLDTNNSHRGGLLFQHSAPGNWAMVASCLNRPLSRGSVHIKSSDPKEHPAIDPNYLAAELDLEILAQGMLTAGKMWDVAPLRDIAVRSADDKLILHPSLKYGDGKSGVIPTTMEDTKDYLRSHTVTEYHPIGTCAMMPKGKGGVVDARLKVYGTGNVRVCDASIFPTHVQGNIVSCVYAVAEKGSDLIKEDYRKGAESKTNGTNGVNGVH